LERRTKSNGSTQVVLITGSSSGIGFEASLTLARNGFFTYASMRNPMKGRKLEEIADNEDLPLEVIQLDVTSDSSVKAAIGMVVNEKGRIDALLNNAGYLLLGCFEDISEKELRDQFETNFFGIVRVTREVIPIMRKQNYGIIINIGSVTGKVGLPVSSGYASTEFALEGLSESIRYELEPFGIQVSLVEPGIVRSNFLKSTVMAERAKNSTSAYHKVTRRLVENLEKMADLGTSPEEVAKVILRAVTSEKLSPRYIVGNDAAMIIENRKSMRDMEFENFVRDVILDKSLK